jgi:hypothetical protein
MSDGGLRGLFRKHLPEFHWQSIETGGTGRGIPDTNGCIRGTELWIEFKAAKGWRVDISPEQVAWAERRFRAGGRVFLAVRRDALGGPRRGLAVDTLYIYSAHDFRTLLQAPLAAAKPLYQGENGPARWDWAQIRTVLTLNPPRSA